MAMGIPFAPGAALPARRMESRISSAVWDEKRSEVEEIFGESIEMSPTAKGFASRFDLRASLFLARLWTGGCFGKRASLTRRER